MISYMNESFQSKVAPSIQNGTNRVAGVPAVSQTWKR